MAVSEMPKATRPDIIVTSVRFTDGVMAEVRWCYSNLIERTDLVDKARLEANGGLPPLDLDAYGGDPEAMYALGFIDALAHVADQDRAALVAEAMAGLHLTEKKRGRVYDPPTRPITFAEFYRTSDVTADELYRVVCLGIDHVFQLKSGRYKGAYISRQKEGCARASTPRTRYDSQWDAYFQSVRRS
jgi:hypothetical protein